MTNGNEPNSVGSSELFVTVSEAETWLVTDAEFESVNVEPRRRGS